MPNQFLAESANRRTDQSGGNNENRNRFVLEIMQEMVNAIGEKKVASRISSTSTFNNIVHQNPVEQFNISAKINGLLCCIRIYKQPTIF